MDYQGFTYTEKLTATHLVHPDFALVKLPGSDLYQDVDPFKQLFDRKIIFALSDAHGDARQVAHYTLRKKALCSS